MSRESFVFLIGCIVFFTPFLRIPREWKDWIFIVAGVLIMFMGYKLRRAAFLRSIMHESGEHRGEAFVEQSHAAPTNTNRTLTAERTE
jgi:uncharacterized membrane protein